MGKYKPYAEYKDSGVEYYGLIPTHWSLQKIKFNSYVKGRQGWQNLRAEEYQDEGPYLVTGAHFDKEGGVDWDRCHHVSLERYERDKDIWLQNDDVLITKDGTIGKIAFIEELPARACLNSHLLVVRDNCGCYIQRFLYYLLLSNVFKGFVGKRQTGTTFFGITQQAVEEFPLALSSLTEQTQIAAFLDHETAKIDRLIEKQEKLIELLKEKRQAVISHAVTKGLNPDAPMKDSGVEWLGEVPEHWEVSCLGFISDEMQTGPFGSQLHAEEYVEGETPVVNPAQIVNSEICPDMLCTVDQSVVARLSHHRLKKGDLIFARRGELGRCAVVGENESGWICGTGSLKVIPCREKVVSTFLLFFIRTQYVASSLSVASKGSTMDNLNTEILSKLRVPLPPLAEQTKIVELLKDKEHQLDLLERRADSAVILLKERRTALISAAVTGKIDVRDWSEPEECA